MKYILRILKVYEKYGNHAKVHDLYKILIAIYIYIISFLIICKFGIFRKIGENYIFSKLNTM